MCSAPTAGAAQLPAGGHVVPGATVASLCGRLLRAPTVSQRVVLMIGTNDLLNVSAICSWSNTRLSWQYHILYSPMLWIHRQMRKSDGYKSVQETLQKMKRWMNRLLERLRHLRVDVTLLTIPPIPVRGYKHPWLSVWKNYNRFLLEKKGKLNSPMLKSVLYVGILVVTWTNNNICNYISSSQQKIWKCSTSAISFGIRTKKNSGI